MQPIQKINYTIHDESNWAVTYGYKGYGYVLRRPNGSVACTMPEGLRSEDRALADFVSAAPDMFMALKSVQAAWDENRLLTSDEAAAIRAALAKATGK